MPLAEKVQRMRDPVFRERVCSEQPEDPHPFFKYVVSDLEPMFVLGDPPNYNPARRTASRAGVSRMGVVPAEFIYDVLLSGTVTKFCIARWATRKARNSKAPAAIC